MVSQTLSSRDERFPRHLRSATSLWKHEIALNGESRCPKYQCPKLINLRDSVNVIQIMPKKAEKRAVIGVDLALEETSSCNPRLKLPSAAGSVAPLKQFVVAMGAQAMNNRLMICPWPSLPRRPLPPGILLRPVRGHKLPNVEGNIKSTLADTIICARVSDVTNSTVNWSINSRITDL